MALDSFCLPFRVHYVYLLYDVCVSVYCALVCMCAYVSEHGFHFLNIYSLSASYDFDFFSLLIFTDSRNFGEFYFRCEQKANEKKNLTLAYVEAERRTKKKKKKKSEQLLL